MAVKSNASPPFEVVSDFAGTLVPSKERVVWRLWISPIFAQNVIASEGVGLITFTMAHFFFKESLIAFSLDYGDGLQPPGPIPALPWPLSIGTVHHGCRPSGLLPRRCLLHFGNVIGENGGIQFVTAFVLVDDA